MNNILNTGRLVSSVPQIASLFMKYDRQGKRLPLPAQIVKLIFRPAKALYRLDQEPTPHEKSELTKINHGPTNSQPRSIRRPDMGHLEERLRSIPYAAY